MRSFLPLLMSLAIFLVQPPVDAVANCHTNGPDEIPLDKNPTGGNGHRIPAQVPISCYYSEGELTFTFSANLGIVECEVVRVSDNEVFDATFYAVSGSSDSLYVSTDADDYEITLMCADGTIYYGEYSIE